MVKEGSTEEGGRGAQGERGEGEREREQGLCLDLLGGSAPQSSCKEMGIEDTTNTNEPSLNTPKQRCRYCVNSAPPSFIDIRSYQNCFGSYGEGDVVYFNHCS